MHQAALNKAIKKALKNGWEPFWHNAWHKGKWEIKGLLGESIARDNECRICIKGAAKEHYDLKPIEVIFDHDFAKALWGEIWNTNNETQPPWKTHLQKMVIADDAIAYLSKNI